MQTRAGAHVSVILQLSWSMFGSQIQTKLVGLQLRP